MSAAEQPKSVADPHLTESLDWDERFLRSRWVGLLVAVAAGIYCYSFAHRGWIPHDEGLLAHCAERVLQGELPHRDFDDAYSGGLSMLHALAFQAWGNNLWSLRIMLLVFSVPFAATVYALAARVVQPRIAILVSCLCLVWSTPNYFASMPSWYNLFFATFGAWALLRYLDTQRMRWLAAAGVFGGLSIVVKIVGLYYVAAVLLFLVDCERRSSAASAEEQSPRSFGFGLFVTGSLAVFVTALVWLVRVHWSPMPVFLFVVPGACLALYLGYSEWHVGRGPSARRFVALFKLLIPFGLGVCLPIGCFLIPYVASGSLGDLWNGLFVLPQLRLTKATGAFPNFVTVLAVVPYAVVLIWPLFRSMGWERRLAPVVAAVLLFWFAACGVYYPAFHLALYSARPLVAVVVAACLLRLLVDEAAPRASAKRDSEIFLFAALAAMVSLVQYPFPHYIYFCYCAPLVALASVYVVAAQPAAPKLLHATVCMFYLLFACVWLNTNFARGGYYRYEELIAPLNTDRGKILVQQDQADLYNELIREVCDRSAPGDYIYAAPDCPEVYFLTERKNPTRTMYDLFDDPVDRARQVLSAIDDHAVAAVVINRAPQFSEPLNQDLVTAITSRFPFGREVGDFVVLWRGNPPQKAETP